MAEVILKFAALATLMEFLIPSAAVCLLLWIRHEVDIIDVRADSNLEYTTPAIVSAVFTLNLLACGADYTGDFAPKAHVALTSSSAQGSAFLSSVIKPALVDTLTLALDALSLPIPHGLLPPDIMPPGNHTGLYCTKRHGRRVRPDFNVSDYIANDMILSFDSPAAMDAYIQSPLYGRDMQHRGIMFGIELGSVGPNWSYKLRTNWSALDDTGYSVNDLQASLDVGDFFTFVTAGASTFQMVMDQAIMSLQGLPLSLGTKFIPFPLPAHRFDPFAGYVEDVFGLLFLFAYMWPFSRLVRNMVDEKETRMRENMKMMGLQSSVFWVSWLIVYAVLFLLVVGMFIAISGPTLFPYTDSSILCLLFYSFAFNLLFLACLCSAFFSRAQSAGTLSPFVLLISFLPYFAVSDPSKSGPSKLFASLLSPVAFSLASKTLVEYQSAFQGITWQNINESHNNTSFAQLLTIMWLDTALYALLVLYLDRVMPSEFGTSESPFFCFSRVFWRRQCCQERESDFEPIPDVPADENTLFEAVPGSVRSVAHIRNLRKQFLDDKGQPFWAVKGVDLDLFEGQLFVLLGHNGAGKTTLFNMLTGMMPPSDGRAWLYGKEISDDMSQIRQSLGFCPQHDVLFPTLTVYEHLSFFLHLKRSSTADAHSEITRTATEVGLEFKLSAAASTLSGGQRRRLSLAIAFIGDSKLVFLDEPTSGVDPHSRRAIWDILNAKKRDRVVVLSTHFMDEADQLGDRIGIMHHGRLQCCGSPLFLKSKFGVGYTLTLTKLVEWSRSKPVDIELQRLITQHIPSANLLSSVGAELSFQLPIAASASFPSLLRSLEQQSTVSSYGLSVTTLEEVFMRVSRLATSVEESENGIDLPKSGPLAASVLHNSSLSMRDSCDSMQSIDLRDDQTSSLQTSALLKAQSLQIPLLPPMSMDTLQGSRFCTQFVALLIKRWHSAIRDRTNMFCQIVLPLILLTVGMALLRIPVNLQFTDLILSPSVYNSPLPVPFNNYTVLGNGTATLPNILDAFRTLPQQSWFASSDSDFVAQPEPFNQSALNDVQMTNALLDSRGEFASSRYGALIFNLSSNSAGITRWPHRKPATATSTASGIVLESVYANVSTLHGLATFTNLGHNLLLQSVGASIETHLFPFEWTQREKEFVQNINGAFSAICIAIAYSFIPAAIAVSVVKEREVKSKHLQLLSGVDALAYWASNFLFDFVCYLIPASIGVGIIFAYGNPTLTGENFATVALAFLLNGLSVIPFTYVCSFCFTSHSTAQNVMIMVYLASGVVMVITCFALYQIPKTRDINDKYVRHVFRLFPNFCLSDTVFFLSARDLLRKGQWDWFISGYDLVYMGAETIVYFALTLVLERFAAVKSIADMCSEDPVLPDPIDMEDDDVKAERQRVHHCDDLIQLRDIRKTFESPPSVAVKSLSFGVQRNQCFGFLGVNGAGKTTALRILCGDESPSSGDALLCNVDAVKDSLSARRLIGYCPQFDALFEFLTGREHLHFYARVRGLTDHQRDTAVDALLERLSLVEFADRPAGTYSGGNKRKLSVAIALIGNPPVVFLDEPSTGVDPVSRRFLWDFLSETMADRAAILTTHSLEECEALCSRIGILTLGQLRCIGTAQHLKDKYGRGFQLDIAVEASSTPDSACSFVEQTFTGVEMLERYHNRLKYRVPDASLVQLFEAIEHNKQRLSICEYSIGQATLEQIFVSFARSSTAVSEN